MKAVFAGGFSALLAEPVRAKLAVPCAVGLADDGDLPALADADVLVATVFSAAMAAAAPALKLVQVPGAGVDMVDFASVPAGVQVANVFGHETGIAEYVIGAMIALSRRFARMDADLRRGVWYSQFAADGAVPPAQSELMGSTLGILGFGHIGQELAKRAAAFGMRVCAIRQNPQGDPPPGVAFVGGPERLDEVLAAADHLVVTMPSNGQTRGLLDARRLALMKPGAFLVNVARADIIDEAALYEALADRRIAGAALDVWYRYPSGPGETMPSAKPFHTLDNVLLTPHASGWTQGMLDARAALIAENIARTARGEPPLNAVGGI